MRTIYCVVSLIVSFVLVSKAADTHIYVSPSGSDQHDGHSPSTAVQTIEHAMSIVPHSGGVVYVELLAGHYDLKNTLTIPRNNLVIRAYNDQEVHVTGGKRVPSSAFKHVTDNAVLSKIPTQAHSQVRVVHLPDVGITDYGMMRKYGGWKEWTAPLEVFYNGQPLHFARWPNEGFFNIVNLPHGQNGQNFRYSGTVPKTLQQETDLWVYGYWYWGWADLSVKVNSLDVTSKTVTLTETPRFGLRTGHWGDQKADFNKQGGYFRFVNALAALDVAGEYYMDKQNGNLYVIFPNSDGNAKSTDEIYVSLRDTCFRFIQNARNVTFEGFTLEVCRSHGIDGTNVHQINVHKMEIRNTGSRAVLFYGDSRDCTISRSLIHHTGGGLYINGGSRKTLVSSGHVIEDNEIYHFSRVGAVGYHGISAMGVGHLIRYNHLYQGQWTGVLYNGNDITMEYNLLHNICVNASDCGAFHTGRDWTTRGNVIRYNIVHDIIRLVPGADVRGVMLDDQSSSTSIIHNVFYNNDVHANIGGGRYNVISYNVMYNALSHSIQVDHRGVKHSYDTDLIRHLHAVPYQSSVWTLRYPEFKYFNLQNASFPEGNQIVENFVYTKGGVEYVYRYSNEFNKPQYFNISHTGFSLGKSDHFNTDIGDYRLRCHAAEWANHVNFEQVPSPNDVGPRASVGPTYLHREPKRISLTMSSNVCTTHAPVTSVPVTAFLPDGSRVNDMYQTSNQGCWMSIPSCTDHINAEGTYRDQWGETHEHAADNETACFHRAVEQWQYCGSHKNEQIAAIYAPTGATRLAGDGCFMAMYGCPNHGGPADGHVMATGKIYRDTYAEQHDNAANDEEKCLQRALAEWKWCGSHRNHPVTSIYRPTAAVRTAGAGCWIHVQKCPKDPGTQPMFYDAYGASNFHTDDIQDACYNQAQYYWEHCGSDSRYPVTAYYRPTASSKTYP